MANMKGNNSQMLKKRCRNIRKI